MTHSYLASPSRTIDVLRRHGLYTRKRLGQHLLIDDNVVGRIIDLAGLRADDVVLEVGPGIGTLTVALTRAAGTVLALEADERLLPVVIESVGGSEGLHVLHADAVRVPLERVSTPDGPPDMLVANLPYSVAATVVLRFLEGLHTLRSMTVMVQAEVADRMTADPGGKDYGSYTVKLGLHAQATGRFGVPRTCFLPPPLVDSTVVRLERLDRGVSHAELRAAAMAADAAFAQRRKTVRNSLVSSLGAGRDDVEEALEGAGIEGEVRAETLSVEAFLELGRALHRRGLVR